MIEVSYERKNIPAKVGTIGIALLLIGALLVAVSFIFDPIRASFNSLISFMFLLSIGIGSLFLVALEYLVGAVWSVPFRRISEILTSLIFIAPLLAIPVLLNMHDMYHWMHQDAVDQDAILQSKEPYLNFSFFLVRFISIIAIFLFFKFFIVDKTQKQDQTGEQSITKRASIFSAIFMPLFAVMITLMAVDFMMSLEPHWFSTIFGVYYFAGTFLVALAVLTYIAVTADKSGMLVKGLTRDHYYNFGALTFAFTNFWAYIAFSQFMLIWYANIPEETFWFIHRSEHGWMPISIGLIFIHFVVPFIALLSRDSKSDPGRLKFIAPWMLFAHFYNLYWLVMPTFSPEGPVFSFYEIAFPVFTIGLVITVFYFASKGRNLVAIGDPRLQRGVNFHL